MQMKYSTERLKLCILNHTDADMVLAFYERNKDYFECWEPARDPNFYTLSYLRATLTIEHNLMLQSKLLRFWVFLKEDAHTIIGTVNFYNIVHGAYSTCQIGYKFDQEYTGYGYAYESIKKAMEILLNEFNLHRIEANIMPSNHRSINLIQKLGFHYEGLAESSIQINGCWEDHARYAYLHEI